MPVVVAMLILACTARDGLEDAHRDLSEALPVFPGAEGFGTDTVAGRGGAVVVVDSLAADGEGSLRAALEQEGPRTIVFATSGTIWLTTDLRVDEPFVTIAGQTAPSPGITVAGAGLLIATHDVLVQHLRIRPGDREEGPRPVVRDAVTIANSEVPPARIVIDHCSLSWGVDETASVTYAADDITFSYNLIAEGLYASLHPEGSHSKGLIIGDQARRVAVVRNVFAHHDDRNPVMKGDTSSIVVNNLVYDPGRFAIVSYGYTGCCPMVATIDRNVVIPGASTREGAPAVHITSKAHRDSRVFAEGNGERLSDRHEVWVDAPPVTVAPLTMVPVDGLEAELLARVGARPMDRDAVDLRVVAQVRERTGGGIDSPEDVGGWPELAENAADWELPEDPSGDADGDGYTNLEHWLHGLAAEVEGAL